MHCLGAGAAGGDRVSLKDGLGTPFYSSSLFPAERVRAKTSVIIEGRAIDAYSVVLQ